MSLGQVGDRHPLQSRSVLWEAGSPLGGHRAAQLVQS